MNGQRRWRRAWYGIAAGVVIAAGIAVGLLLPHGQAQSTRAVVYDNISRHFKACVLATPTADAGPVWEAVRAASQNRPINAQRITAPSGPTSALVPYLNSLVSLRCQLIVTAGGDLAGPLTTVAKAHPDLAFLNVSQATTNLPNVSDLPDHTPSRIIKAVDAACAC